MNRLRWSGLRLKLLALAFVLAIGIFWLSLQSPFEIPGMVADGVTGQGGQDQASAVPSRLGRRERRQARVATQPNEVVDANNRPHSVGLEDLLRSENSDDREEAVRRINGMINSQPKPLFLGIVKWLPLLFKNQYYELIKNASEVAITFRPQDTETVATLQEAKAWACLLSGDKANALVEAKSFYNVAPLAMTRRAERLLFLVHDSEANRASDVLDMTAHSASRKDASVPDIIELLSTVKIDPLRYKIALEQMGRETSNYNDRLSLGNLLLIADKPAAARDVFLSILQLKDIDKEKCAASLDGILRAIRTEDMDPAVSDRIINELRIGEVGAVKMISTNSFLLTNAKKISKKVLRSDEELRPQPDIFESLIAEAAAHNRSADGRGRNGNVFEKIGGNSESPSASSRDSITSVGGDTAITEPISSSRVGARAPRFVTALACDKVGNIWAGVEDDGLGNGGVWCFDKASKQWKQYTTSNGLGDNNGYAIKVDELGRVWVGHLNHGVSVFNGNAEGRWQCYEVTAKLSRTDSLAGPLGERVFDIAVSPRNGDVWIATNYGLSRYCQNDERWSYYTKVDGLPSNQIQAIAVDSDGDVFCGSQSDGIAVGRSVGNQYSWERIKLEKSLQETQAGGLHRDVLVNDLLVTEKALCVATTHGFAWSIDKGSTWRWLSSDLKVVGSSDHPIPSGLGQVNNAGPRVDNYFKCLEVAPKGRVWVGTRQEGLGIVDLRTGGYKKVDGFPAAFVTGIAVDDGSDRTIIATYGDLPVTAIRGLK